MKNNMEKFDDKYMSMAKIWAQNSHAIRNKVGAIVVKNNTIISDGFNGTPSGFDNNCEIIICDKHTCGKKECDDSCMNCSNHILKTKDIVIHAECNAITKLARNTQSGEDSTLYVTLSPCIECAKMIIQTKIKRVVYETEYRDTRGIELLKEAGIEVNKITKNNY